MLRQILFIIILSMLCTLAIGQVSQGRIIYEFRMDVHRTLPPEREDLKAMIPQFRTEKFELLFNTTQRLFRPYTDVNEMASPGGPRMFRMPRHEIYANTESRQWVSYHEFMGQEYLIIDTLTLAPWRLGNEYMEIAGHLCQMAWYKDTISNEEITAWFTLSIQPFIGPDRFNTLPGAILALDINNGERVWVARQIEINNSEQDAIVRPTKGQKITRDEYLKMVQEQMERMRNMPGSRF